jgi:hypothetical protein
MFELFLNPANMIVGGALVASPILIHLINRMRFRRVRWAAMEFLLKSQKRNRRRLIIEQLILLALRMLLVLLTALLLARFLGFAWAGLQAKNTVHAIVFDDRLSMADQWKTEDGEIKNSFQIGKDLLQKDLAKLVAQARTPQQLVFFRLSEPGTRFESRLNEESLREFAAELGRTDKPPLLHLDLAKGVEAAREVLDKNAQDNRFLHIVSDFRQEHWVEPQATELMKKLDGLSKAGVKISLLDTGHPYRSENQRLPLYHDNLAVVELRPETRIAAEGMPVQFTVTVANFSPSERKNVRVTVKVEGAERPEGSLTMLSVPPGHTSATFQVALVRLGFNEVTANLENEEAGLQADNIRYAVVEVRRQVPVLIVDGDLSNGDKPGGDTYHLRTLLTSARGFEVVRGSVTELERPNLTQFPSIYLLNVRELNDRALKNLESYVREGGSIAFFLGDRVNPDYYNKKLYVNGKGVFPAPLADRPSPPLTDEEKLEKLNLLDPRYQIFIRNPAHPVFAEVAKYRDFFKFLSIDRYYPVPRQRWDAAPGRVEELVTLPNDRPVVDYQSAAQDLLDSLPVDDPQYAKFRPALERHRRAIRDTLTGKSLHPLATALDDLLHDAGEPGNSERPKLAELWDQPDDKIQALRGRVEKFRAMVQYGDPLVIAARFGRGRTVAFLTTAGKKWNDWAGGGPASVTYPVVMLELQKYLTSLDAEENRTVGTPLEIQAESSRYEARVHAFFQHAGRGEEAAARPGDSVQAPPQAAGLRDLGEQLGSISGSRLSFLFDKANEPGVYYFDLTPRAELGGESKKETRAYAFNLDTANESDLRRVSKDELERVGKLNTPAAGSIADMIDRQTDLSESAWIYLVFLVVLVAEQALAVHLSFHLDRDQGSGVRGQGSGSGVQRSGVRERGSGPQAWGSGAGGGGDDIAGVRKL